MQPGPAGAQGIVKLERAQRSTERGEEGREGRRAGREGGREGKPNCRPLTGHDGISFAVVFEIDGLSDQSSGHPRRPIAGDPKVQVVNGFLLKLVIVHECGPYFYIH